MALKALIILLDIPDSDYWYDSACELARKIIDANGDEIFKTLILEWRSWPEFRQEHLAYILGQSPFKEELVLINELLTSEYASVVFRAREALYENHQKT